MKVLYRYILGSLMKIIGGTVLLVTMLIVLFDVFSNLELYLNYGVSYAEIGMLTLLFIPEAIGYAIGPAALFASTYFLSMLHANNEMIVLSNIGYPYRKIITPIIAIGLLLVVFQFTFSEQVAIAASQEKTIRQNTALQVRQLGDNRNVTLQSPEGRYVMHAGRFYENDNRIVQVTVVMVDEHDRLVARIDAASGTYNGSYWVLHDALRYLVDAEGQVFRASRESEYHNRTLNLEPTLFKNLQADITTMELSSALKYVQAIRIMDSQQYAPYASDLANRVLGNLTPLILMIISCSTVFTWKKNVLILSIIGSLSISVVYFVMHMLSMILAKQGIISPLLGPLAPMGILLMLSIISLTIRRI
jgi:lipopolysaccharide export system permease protein